MIRKTLFELYISPETVIAWRGANMIYHHTKIIHKIDGLPFIYSTMIINHRGSVNLWQNFIILNNYTESKRRVILNNSQEVYYKMF